VSTSRIVVCLGLIAFSSLMRAQSSSAAQRIAAETGDNLGNYVDARSGSASQKSCNVLLRVVQAKNMKPLLNIDVAIDTQYNPNDPFPFYPPAVSPDGRQIFSGGHLHEITTGYNNGSVGLGTVPQAFVLVVDVVQPGNAGIPDVVYRQCFAPTTVLLYIVNNLHQPDVNYDLLWAKSGKYATPPAN
jgi:hypothetical protein